MDPLITGIGSVIALFAGSRLKANPAFKNKYIPICTFIISLLTQIVAASQAQAAIQFGTIFHDFGNIFVRSLLQTFMTTGVHSVGKNVVAAK